MFDHTIFINCPFDEDYKPIQKALVFTAMSLGFEPVLSTTKSSGHIRIEEIKKLIASSKYSIHDISRCVSQKKGEYARFNMPYELGIDIGCTAFGSDEQKSKMCLILDEKLNAYDKTLSDISGQDIKVHGNDCQKAIKCVLDWFETLLEDQVPSVSKIWNAYLEFSAKLHTMLEAQDYTQLEIKNVSHTTFVKVLRTYLDN